MKMKRIEDIEFENNIKEIYKNEIKEINSIYEELEKDKNVQKVYRKFLKRKEKENLKFNYNQINKTMNTNNLVKSDTKKFVILDNSDYKVSNHNFC